MNSICFGFWGKGKRMSATSPCGVALSRPRSLSKAVIALFSCIFNCEMTMTNVNRHDFMLCKVNNFL